MITQGTIEKILDATRIEEVVLDFVNLRRRGVNMIGLCPFHPEKTPSFTVAPAKNLFKCFGCGKGGDAIGFLKEHEGFNYPEALRWLAAKYHIELEETAEKRSDNPEDILKDQIFVATQYARDFFVKQLWESAEGQGIGLAYFKERGFRESIIRKFDLGFAPISGNSLAIQSVQEGFRPEILKEAGLMTSHNRDFFKERVMFTIHSLSGKPIAFAGRIMGKIQGPKYINSPESPIYHKSKVLYGLFQARQAIRKADVCYLVEGYTDVLSLVQEGIENVVASSGTALTPEQIRLIKRFTDNITILYDGDAAGLNAALRGLDLILEQDMNVRVVMLPSGEDPDSYLTKTGHSAFLEYLASHQQDFILFKTSILLDESKDDPIARAKVIKEIVGSIARVTDALKRSEYTKVCADRLNVAEALLIREINQALTQKINKAHKDHPGPTSEPDHNYSEEAGQGFEDAPFRGEKEPAQEIDLVRILASAGMEEVQLEDSKTTVANYILQELEEEVLQEIDNQQVRLFLLTAKRAHVEGKTLDPSFFKNHSEGIIRAFALRFQSVKEDYSDNWEKRHHIVLQNQPVPDKNYTRDARQALYRFQLKYLNHLCDLNARQIKSAYEAQDDEQLRHYLEFQSELMKMRNELASDQLNNTVIR